MLGDLILCLEPAFIVISSVFPLLFLQFQSYLVS